MKNTKPIIMSVSNMEDIKILKENSNIKYINLDITSPNLEVISYLIKNGDGYSYSDCLDGKKGYIYVSYDIFKSSELLLLDIINGIPDGLSELEMARYLYITLGRILGYDINVLPDKNETFNLKIINTINNIWGCLYNLRGTNVSFTKIYLYLCRLAGINCELVAVSQLGYLKNKLVVDNKVIMTDITQDIPFIQASFKTRNFLGYNDNIEMDKKIKYIKDDYSELKIEKALRNLDYNGSNIVRDILMETQDIIKVCDIKPIELGLIYDIIFSKYCPNCNIVINNLFMMGTYNTKEHFILISFENSYYSYNYTRGSFVEISYDEIIKNIEKKKIGIYLNEKIPMFSVNKEKAI